MKVSSLDFLECKVVLLCEDHVLLLIFRLIYNLGRYLTLVSSSFFSHNFWIVINTSSDPFLLFTVQQLPPRKNSVIGRCCHSVEQSLKSTVRFRAWKRQTKCRSQYQQLNESNREYKETTGSHGSGVSGSRRCHDDTSSVLWEPALGIFACCARFLRARESVPTHDVQTKDTIMSWLWRHTQLELEQHACFARVELASDVLWRLLMFCRKKSTYGYSSGMIVEHAPNSSSTWRMELKHSIRPASQPVRTIHKIKSNLRFHTSTFNSHASKEISLHVVVQTQNRLLRGVRRMLSLRKETPLSVGRLFDMHASKQVIIKEGKELSTAMFTLNATMLSFYLFHLL